MGKSYRKQERRWRWMHLKRGCPQQVGRPGRDSMLKRGFREVSGMRKWPQKASTLEEEEEMHGPGVETGSQHEGIHLYKCLENQTLYMRGSQRNPTAEFS